MKRIPILFLATLCYAALPAQSLNIKGPQCVRSGVEYQYIIERAAGSSIKGELCLEGGVFARTRRSCISDSVFFEVRVVWTDSIRGSLQLHEGSNQVTHAVNIAQELQPGAMDTTVILQIVKVGARPRDILCSPASGGGCNPIYEYQWQQSTDNIEWTDINEMGKQHFHFISTVVQSIFYRRKVTDITSGTIAYTTPVAVFAEPEAKQTL